MFGFFKKRTAYKDKSLDYQAILRRDFDMLEPYVGEFIKYSGDELSKTEHNIRSGYKSSGMSSSIKAIINDFGFEYSAIVFVCITTYMTDFKKGKTRSKNFEYAVVGLLIKLKEITRRVDRRFSEWLIKNKDQKWPNLDRLVFGKEDS
ncbi:hypothetical protein [Geothermobacter ehrlichii]|uniref:hypothetical protein n=1 Tax=Geothermobacter ehrlichii TaxID=213224 RepID=UPI0011E68669|nr:hypothetical protein [Geothermobacter ehrlichii]